MSDLDRAFAQLRAEDALWALSPEHLHGLAERLARTTVAEPVRRLNVSGPLTNQIIPVMGPLARRGSFITKLLGLPTYDSIRSQLAAAVADKSVQQIILYVDSPGGAATGCEECADAVARAARIKPLIAYADGMAASAAYWIASQASKLIVTPSGEVGSIGVIAVHTDISQALLRAGIKPTILLSNVSPRKADLNPYEPISADAKKRSLSEIDKIALKFVRAVSSGRKVSPTVVADRFGRGGMLLADEAKAAGMVDGIATFDDLLGGNANQQLPAVRRSHRWAMIEKHQRDASPPVSPRRRRLALLAQG
jgi:ClpP class serine protease